MLDHKCLNISYDGYSAATGHVLHSISTDDMFAGAENKGEPALGDLRWICIGVAAKLFATVGVLRPGVAMLLSPFHASC